MKKFQWLSCILTVLTLGNLAHAANISVLNVRPDQCNALQPLLADLNTVNFPSEWTVYVACDAMTWETILQKADVTKTQAAFTDRKNKFTIVNGLVYAPSFSFANYSQKNPQGVLRHELGHITCVTSNEEKADHFADKGVCR